MFHIDGEWVKGDQRDGYPLVCHVDVAARMLALVSSAASHGEWASAVALFNAEQLSALDAIYENSARRDWQHIQSQIKHIATLIRLDEIKRNVRQ
jgi:hypothetical protein